MSVGEMSKMIDNVGEMSNVGMHDRREFKSTLTFVAGSVSDAGLFRVRYIQRCAKVRYGEHGASDIFAFNQT